MVEMKSPLSGRIAALFLALFLAWLTCVDCIMFNLAPNTQKCLKEELEKNNLVTGEFEVSEVPGQSVDYFVKDSNGQTLAQRPDLTKGKFSFVTDAHETYEICFISRVPANLRGVVHIVSLDIKHGVEAKSYEGLGEAAKLKPIEVELKRLEDMSDAIVQDFMTMKRREEEMRNTNESTNNRVLYFSIFSMCCLLGLATWQVMYLRRYFKAKKLIE